MNEDKKIPVIYTRVSTTDQAREGHSLEEQENRIRKKCEAYGYKVYKVYVDAGFSAKDTNRPAYQQMMADMRKGKFNVIMAYKMDRISRSVSDFEDFFKLTAKYNCDVELFCEQIDTSTASGMMFVRMLAIFAQFERDVIKERTLVGVEGALNKGHYGGPIPFGYTKEKGSKLFKVDPETAPIVVEMFNMCLKGKSYVQIAHHMKKKYSYFTYTKRDKNTGEVTTYNRTWDDSSISKILNNKIYYGVWETNKNIKGKDGVEIKGKIPPIITEEVFYECQDNIIKNTRNYYRNKCYLFMQKLVCPKCGRVMACMGTKKPNGKEYKYYKCKDCATSYKEDVIQEYLVEQLISFLELYLVLEHNYVVIDTDTATALKKGKIDNTIRYAMDSIAIEKRLNNSNYNLLKHLWELISYEVKSAFIYEYIDTLKIKQYKVRGEKEPRVKLLDVKLRPHKLRKFFGMHEKNMIDFIGIDAEGFDASEVVFTSRKQADDYIEVLRRKYNIRVINFFDTNFPIRPEDININNIFKMVRIVSNRAVEKNEILCLEVLTN